MDYGNTMCQSNPFIYRWIILCEEFFWGVIAQVQPFFLFFLWAQLTCYWIALFSLAGSHYSPKVICNDGLSSMSWSTLCHWLHLAKLLKRKALPVRSPHKSLQIHELNSLTIVYFVSLLTEGWMSYWSEVLGFDQPVNWRWVCGWVGGALMLPVYIKAWYDCIQFRQLLQMACKSIRLDRTIIHSLFTFTSFVSLYTPIYYYITKNTFIRVLWAAVAGLLSCLWGFLMFLCFIFYWFVNTFPSLNWDYIGIFN